MYSQVGFYLAVVVAALAGCNQTVVRPPSIASDAGTKAVAKYDANKDGVLDYQELASAPGLRAAVVRIKKLSKPRESLPPESVVKSQKISAAEIDARIAEW